MSKRFWKFAAGWFAVAVVIIAAGFAFRTVIPRGLALPTVVATRTERDVTVATLSNGAQSISAPTGGYAVTVPTGWYVESPVSSSGVTVYPDYSPDASSSEPLCKIEFYVSANPSGTPLAAWVEKELHDDPTEDVVQTSMEAMTVDGWPAIRWAGMADIYPMINTYVAVGARVFEIVPVTASGNDLSVVPCMDGVDTFISSLKLQA